jgi:predicted  nucleic acid-binding Zn-ribbon protein
MTDALRVLWLLEGEDQRMRELNAALGRIPRELAEVEGRIASGQRVLEEQTQRVKQLQLERRGFEKEIEAHAEQERKFQGQLFQVKTNQEYQALLHEIEGVKQKRSLIETRVLESLEEEEQLGATRAAHEKAATESRRLGEARRQELETEQARLEREAGGVRERRGALLAQLPPGLRGRYERIHGALDGRAVVAVLRNACGGCMRQLPPQRVQEARRQDTVVVCDGCGRLVVWPPDQA